LAIDSPEALRRHLQWALELEHSTIPPYPCALYSIREDANREDAEVVRSVFVEEMLHMMLIANALNAVGGGPAVDTPRMLPTRTPGRASCCTRSGWWRAATRCSPRRSPSG
jgi:Ferritin-like